MPDLKKCMLAVLALFVFGQGCSGGSGGGPVAFERYCDVYSRITCEAAQKCDCLGNYSIELCEMVQQDECESEVEEPVNSGVKSYDAVEAGNCIDRLKAIIFDCSLEGDDYPESCDRMLTGRLSAGQICGEDGECQPGLECYNDTCTALPQVNEACLDGYTCASDLYCSQDGLCRHYKGMGEDCASESWACDDDLYCDSRVNTCQPYLGAGDSCAHDRYACDDDLYCSYGTQTCRPYPTAGQDCADSSGTCADDLYCDSDSLCKPQLGGGAECSYDEQCLSYSCVDGFCEEDEDGDCPFF